MKFPNLTEADIRTLNGIAADALSYRQDIRDAWEHVIDSDQYDIEQARVDRYVKLFKKFGINSSSWVRGRIESENDPFSDAKTLTAHEVQNLPMSDEFKATAECKDCKQQFKISELDEGRCQICAYSHRFREHHK